MFRTAVIALALVFGGLQYRLWVADGGYAEVHRLKVQVEELAERNEAVRARNEALEAEIADLKSGVAAMEGRARADLGMIGPGERFYLIAEQTD